MEFRPNDTCATSESAPLIEPVESGSEQDLFMVPLKRPSPRLPPSRYRNVRPRTPPRSPAAPSPRSHMVKATQSPPQGPPISGHGVKPASPPMFTSPLMSPESGNAGSYGSPNPQSSLAQCSVATSQSLAYKSPPMSVRATKLGSSPIMSPEMGSAGQSPQPESSGKGSTQHSTAGSRSTGEKPSPSTKASSVYDGPPAILHDKAEAEAKGMKQQQQQPQQLPPEIPPLSQARGLRPQKNLGLALHLDVPPPANPHLLAPSPINTRSPSQAGGRAATWTVPDSPFERLSQLRATPDSAYDRARLMEVRRSEWKHVVYRFPVRGKEHWVIDADLTESSHARLADVARRSSEGFEWNGDYELANIYRVLAAAHGKVMEEMRAERRALAASLATVAA